MKIERFLREVPAGGVCINDIVGHVNNNLPFGGGNLLINRIEIRILCEEMHSFHHIQWVKVEWEHIMGNIRFEHLVTKKA
jgi:hypothetical protein